MCINWCANWCARCNNKNLLELFRRMKFLIVHTTLIETFVRPRPCKFFFHKTRARSQQIYS